MRGTGLSAAPLALQGNVGCFPDLGVAGCKKKNRGSVHDGRTGLEDTVLRWYTWLYEMNKKKEMRRRAKLSRSKRALLQCCLFFQVLLREESVFCRCCTKSSTGSVVTNAMLPRRHRHKDSFKKRSFRCLAMPKALWVVVRTWALANFNVDVRNTSVGQDMCTGCRGSSS